ncbi:MAG: sigma-70 family RNA polymerase sigma factor [Chloroflexi bacterium]|nr:sigma-70 family RNA polymerase sigma factor [Chloroflexota bacterium]MCI0868712.1 sigma-70 family RNA polymerase sigma factor [Chloroflexota bacterium]
MQAQINANAEVATLVRMAQEGDTSSFGELYERFFDQIYRYVSFKTGSPSEAEDITGEVFVRMLESIHKFKWQGHPFSSWLFRIAHNLVVDHFRRKGKRNVVSLDNTTINVEAVAVDVDSHIDTEMSMDEVRKAMVGLTVLQKEVISLRFAAGLSVAETAEAVGKKENAVKALQHAGLKKLRRFLNPELSTPSILLQQQQET